MSTIPDPATTDWVPLWNLGAPSGLVMIEDKLLGADGEIDFVNIPATYKHLRLVGSIRGSAAADIVGLQMMLNGDAGANYDSQLAFAYSATVGGQLAEALAGGMSVAGGVSGDTARANRFSPLMVDIPDYADTTREKSALYSAGHSNPGVDRYLWTGAGWWRSTAAINRLTLVPGTGTWKAGSRATLYALTDVAGAPRFPQVTYGTTPPASPIDGDEWILPADATSGVMWRFRYRAASASAYKWEFVGGPPLLAKVDTLESTTSTTYVALTTPGPSVTVPRAGDWIVEHGYTGGNLANTSVPSFMSYDIGATAAVDADAVVQQGGYNSAAYTSVMRRNHKDGLAAVTLASKYRTDGVGYSFSRRWLSIVPVRVS